MLKIAGLNGPSKYAFFNLDQGLSLFANDQLVSKLKNVILVPKEPSFPFLHCVVDRLSGTIVASNNITVNNHFALQHTCVES